MNHTQTKTNLTIDLESGERFEDVTFKDMSYGGKAIQVWVKIVKE